MSFVLDALRRAEAERQRGSVPGLHAQTLAAPSEPSGGRRRTAWVLPVVTVLTGVVLAAVLVAWLRSPEAPIPVLTAAQPAVQPAAQPPARPPGALPAAARPPTAAPARVATSSGAASPPAPSTAGQAPAPAPAVRAAPPSLPRSVPVAVEAEPAPKAVPRAARVQRFQDLPEALRRQIPPMSFGGATDSPERSARMLIINGQVWREGDEPANGLRLERISLRSAVFLWREERFEVAY